MVRVLFGICVLAAGFSLGGFRSPFDVAFSPDGRTLAVSDRTAGCVYLLDPSAGAVVETVALDGSPMGVTWT